MSTITTDSEEKIYTSTNKEETLQYLKKISDGREISENVYGAYDAKATNDHFAEIDQGIIKALNGCKQTTIHGDTDRIVNRFIDGLNYYLGKYPSFVQEVYATNNDKTFGKLFPSSKQEDIILAKRSSKKHGIQKGMLLYRLVKYPASVNIITEKRAFTGEEFDNIFYQLERLGIDLNRTSGDKFLTSREVSRN